MLFTALTKKKEEEEESGEELLPEQPILSTPPLAPPPFTPFIRALLLTFPLFLVECVQAEQESVFVSAVAVWTCHSSLWKLDQAGGRSRLDTV